jgi:predicted Zn finger-like uncharacterized protein
VRAVRFWQTSKWRDVFSVDFADAEAEGLAAGTGLLTGDLADSSDVRNAACPRCQASHRVEVDSVDLIAASVSRRCGSCGYAWTVAETVARRS